MAEFIKKPALTSVDLALEAAVHELSVIEHDYVAVLEAYRQAVETLAAESTRRRLFQRKYYALLNGHRQGTAR